MSAAVAAARIGDLGQEGKQTTPERCVHAAPPCCSSAKSRLSSPRAILLSSQRETVNGPAPPTARTGVGTQALPSPPPHAASRHGHPEFSGLSLDRENQKQGDEKRRAER